MVYVAKIGRRVRIVRAENSFNAFRILARLMGMMNLRTAQIDILPNSVDLANYAIGAGKSYDSAAHTTTHTEPRSILREFSAEG